MQLSAGLARAMIGLSTDVYTSFGRSQLGLQQYLRIDKVLFRKLIHFS